MLVGSVYCLLNIVLQRELELVFYYCLSAIPLESLVQGFFVHPKLSLFKL